LWVNRSGRFSEVLATESLLVEWKQFRKRGVFKYLAMGLWFARL